MEAKWIAFWTFAILKGPDQYFLFLKWSNLRKQMIEKYSIFSVTEYETIYIIEEVWQ